MTKRYSEEQIIGFPWDGVAGIAAKDLSRKHGLSEAGQYLWKSKFGGMSVSHARRLKALEAENARLTSRWWNRSSRTRSLARRYEK